MAEVNTSMNAHVPFAVVGSTDFVKVGNKMMRSRQYPWGTVQGKQSCDYFFLSIHGLLTIFCYSGK